MSFKKQYLKKKSVCKVTFTVPKQLAAFASTVHLVGDFNDWNKSITPMKRLKIRAERLWKREFRCGRVKQSSRRYG